MNPAIPPTKSSPFQKRARILVVENDADSPGVLQEMLTDYLKIVKPIRATNSQEAADYLIDCLAIGHGLPWLIVVNLSPDEPTGGTIEQLRSLPIPICHLPLVVFGASDRVEDIRQSYEQGATSYFIEPTTSEGWKELFDAFRDYWWDTVALPELRY